MEKSEMKEKLIKIIEENLGVNVDSVQDDAHFVDDLGADSLDTVELVMEIEESFDIEIPDEDAEKLTTLKASLDYLEEHM